MTFPLLPNLIVDIPAQAPKSLADYLLPWRWTETRTRDDRLAGLTIVCLSDTHGQHRQLTVPDGDLFLHSGDYTRFGSLQDAVDFNDWLGQLPHRHKVVVQGNHEANAPWKGQADRILSHARLLRHESIEVDGIRIFGSDFFWPCSGPNPYYDQIPDRTDVVVVHGPAHGHLDQGRGCRSLYQRLRQVRPRLVVSGHIHDGRGIQFGSGSLPHTVFVNAACAADRHQIRKNAIVLRFESAI